MNLTPPLFTIIIPTRNRSEYLYHSLKTCITQDYENLEIIVSDDFSTDNTKQMVDKFIKSDNRIRYITPSNESNVGMLENFEFALNHVKPGFVLALGGDDGLMPNSVSKMWGILKNTGQEILSWPTVAYFYPCQKVKNGQIVLQTTSINKNENVKRVNSETFLKRQSETLWYTLDNESPMFYVKGVVSTEVIKRVKARSKNGNFYSCSTPDGYSGIVLAGEVNEWIYYNKPLTIHGVSPTSQGLGYLTKGEDAKIHSESFFEKAKEIPMHKELGSQPYSPLITLMTADFLLTARDLPGWPGKYKQFDNKLLLSNSIKELEDGLYPEDRIARELEILKNIAIKHDLLQYFEKELKNSVRNDRKPLEGNAFSRRLIYLDASDFKVNNVFEASFFAYNFYNTIPKMKFLSFINALINSVKYRFLSFRIGTRLENYG